MDVTATEGAAGPTPPAIPPSHTCRNCGAHATGHFCPNCGQETRVALPTFAAFTLSEGQIAISGDGQRAIITLTDPGLDALLLKGLLAELLALPGRRSRTGRRPTGFR